MHEGDHTPSRRALAGRTGHLVLVVGLVLAAFLRLYGLGVQDFWLDEIHSLANAAARRAEFQALPHEKVIFGLRVFSEAAEETGVADVWRGMVADTHPPVYFVLLHLWRRVAGDGEFAARLPTVLFSVLAIIPLFLIMREHGKPKVGAWIVVGLAVTYAHIHMAQQCRPYSLGMFWVAISYWSLVRLQAKWKALSENARTGWAVVYGLSTYLAVMTHYFTAIAMAGQAIFVWRYFRGRLLRTWIFAAGAAALAFGLTWGPQLYAQYDFISAQDWLNTDESNHAWHTILRFCDMPYRLLFVHDPVYVSVWRSALCLLGVVFLLVVLRRSRRTDATVFVCWYVTAAAFLLLIDLTTGRETLKHVRYLSVLAPALVGMIMPSILACRRRGRVLWASAFAVAVVMTLRLPTQDYPYNGTAAGLIAERMAPETLLIFDTQGWPPFWTTQVYHPVAYYLGRFPQSAAVPFVLIREKPNDALHREIEAFRRLVVVSPRLDGIPNPAPTRFQEVDETGWLNHIGRVFVFSRKEP